MTKKDLVKDYKNVYKKSIKDVKHYGAMSLEKINLSIKKDFNLMQQELKGLKADFQEAIKSKKEKD